MYFLLFWSDNVPSLDLELAIETGGDGPMVGSDGRRPSTPNPIGGGSGGKLEMVLLFCPPPGNPECGGVTRSPRLKGREGEYGEPERGKGAFPFMLGQSGPGVMEGDAIVWERGTALMSARGVCKR